MNKSIFGVAIFLFMVSMPLKVFASDGSSYDFDGYTYNWWWDAVESPAAFEVERTIDESNMAGVEVQGFDDVCTSKDGRIFLVDTLASRVDIVDDQGNFITSIKAVKDQENKIVVDEDTGKQLVLESPEGAYYSEDENALYIANTGGNSIVVLDGTTYTLLREITEPEKMSGVTEFKPSKVAVDSAGRIYIVVQSSYEGLIELNPDGSFSRYFGVNIPEVNLMDYFWKSISSKEQKEKMSKNYAPAFNNVEMDEDGFVYAVSYDAAAEDMVFRFNSSGKNILREEGDTWVIGDLHSLQDEKSQFTDIAVTNYGVYAVLDKTKGRIFIYDYDGQLLNAFGTLGRTKGSLNTPSAISWLGDKLVVTDSKLKCAYIYQTTDFGAAALSASEEYYNGQWDEALIDFQKVLDMNANYEIAYVGIGKNYLMKEEYKKAMYYFKLGNNRTFYSKAFNGYRGEVLKEHFGIVVVVFLVCIGGIVVSEIRYHKKGGTQN